MKLFVSIAALLLTSVLSAQTDSVRQPPYKRFPTPPPFRLLQADSSSYFSKSDLQKKKPLLLIAFSPDCEHCQKETEDIILNIDKLKKIQIVMATWQPFADMRKFYVDYKMFKYSNITIGRDESFLIPPFYNIRNLPFMALYDKKGNLITTAEGSLPISKVIELFKE